MAEEKFARALRAGAKRAALWSFWPAAALVVWGELTPVLPHGVSDLLDWDKAQHVIAYCGLAGLATLAWGRRLPALLILAGVLALGGTLEILQSYVGRDAEWGDMAANTVGAFTGLGAALLLMKLATLVDARRRD